MEKLISFFKLMRARAIQNLEAELSQVKISLSNVNSQLSSSQSQLNAYSLPIGVAIPSIIALVLAILMLRGRSK
jgi:hypothetical protein